ncbi:MAG TPA: hypothetical protein VLS90_04290 [Thermodesulfobacteriota bacterium]|nr:hypothetical protein [Thermodesulfobacteriota bacterium]
MNHPQEERPLLEKARILLDARAASLDGPVAERLEEIRLEALNASGGKGWINPIAFRWKAVGALASAAAATAILFFWMHSPAPDFPVLHGEDLEILASQEPIEVYKELDFYRWLAAKESGT